MAIPITQYRLETFLRGRVGTDNNVGIHTDQDQVLVIDSTVKPRRMELADIGRELKFKFVSAGQGIEDAAVVTQTLHGNSLKPLAPTNLRGSRNTALDLLVEWDRRERLPIPMMNNAGVPLSEEQEIYVVEVYDGADLVRTARNPNVQVATFVEWEEVDDIGDNFTLNADGSMEFNTDTVNPGIIRSKAQFSGDFALEFTAPATEFPSFFGLLPASTTMSADFPSGVFQLSGLPYFFNNFGVGIEPQDNGSFAQTWVPDEKFLIVREGGVVRFFKAPEASSTPVPFFEMSVSSSESLRLFAYCEPNVGSLYFGETRIRYGKKRAFNYTSSMQVENFSSTQALVTVRVYQESAIVGKGFYAEADL
jgi:hypothetical protein